MYRFSVFLLLLAMITGCSKHETTGWKDEPTTTVVIERDDTSWLSIVSTENGAEFSGVKVKIEDDGGNVPLLDSYTPIDSIEVASGVSYKIEGTMDGYNKYETTATVAAGSHLIVPLVMTKIGEEPPVFYANISVTPDDSLTMTLNGQSVDLGITEVNACEQRLKVSRPGYVSIDTTFTPVADDTVDVTLEMVQLPPDVHFWLNLSVTPDDANRSMDNAPVSLGVSEIAEGEHVISVSKTGYVQFDTTFTAVMNDTVDIDVVLSEEVVVEDYYWLNLFVTPDDATIQLDGSLFGAGVNTINSGSHVLSVTKDGFVAWDTTFTAILNDTVNIDVVLQEEVVVEDYYWLSLNVSPDETTILLDGSLWGTGVSTISVGDHNLQVSKDEHVPFDTTFTAILNDTVFISVVLQENAVGPLSGAFYYDPETRVIRLEGDFFTIWTTMMINGSVHPMLEVEVSPGFEYVIPETYTKIQFVDGDWNDPATWWYPGRNGHTLTPNGAEWVQNDDRGEAWYWLHELLDPYLEVTSEPSGAQIVLDDVMPWPNWPVGHTVTPSGTNKVDLGPHTVTVSLDGYEPQTVPFEAYRGDTTRIHVVLVETPPPPEPPVEALRIEYADGKVRLYGEGHEEWLGLECYFPDQNESTGWFLNLWVIGTDMGDYVEWTVPEPYDHVVIWKNAVAGYETQGGSGIEPRFADWANLEAGTGVDRINVTPGYAVLER